MVTNTRIVSNGSRWAGQSPLEIDALLKVLKEHPLNAQFAPFITKSEIDPSQQFNGNFVTLSHVFNIHTNDPELIETLTAAIHENMQRSDYRPLPEPKADQTEQPDLFEVNQHG